MNINIPPETKIIDLYHAAQGMGCVIVAPNFNITLAAIRENNNAN